MAEKTLSLDTAVDTLADLSQSAESDWDRYVITNTGKPQSVLLSYQEYIGMKETIALMQQPETLAQLDEALGDIANGNRVPWRSADSTSISAVKIQSMAKKKLADSDLKQTS